MIYQIPRIIKRNHKINLNKMKNSEINFLLIKLHNSFDNHDKQKIPRYVKIYLSNKSGKLLLKLL